MTETRPNRLPPKILCPRCGEVTAWAGNPHRPFCSERCRLIDLGAWASEDYRIPGKSQAPDSVPESAETPAPDDDGDA